MENINWFGHASFYFNDQNGNKIYFIDPFQLSNRAKEKADIIFITHAHPDHFSPEDISQIIKQDTILVAPPDILEKIDIDNERKIAVKPNENYEVKGFKFETIPAYNTHPNKLNFHPKENNWVGYIFELNNQKIYHAGDTDFIDEMKELKNKKLDIAMIPMDGIYCMDSIEAANAANYISARITVPIHYRNQNPEKYQELEDEFKNLVKNSNVVILEELK